MSGQLTYSMMYIYSKKEPLSQTRFYFGFVFKSNDKQKYWFSSRISTMDNDCIQNFNRTKCNAVIDRNSSRTHLYCVKRHTANQPIQIWYFENTAYDVSNFISHLMEISENLVKNNPSYFLPNQVQGQFNPQQRQAPQNQNRFFAGRGVNIG